MLLWPVLEGGVLRRALSLAGRQVAASHTDPFVQQWKIWTGPPEHMLISDGCFGQWVLKIPEPAYPVLGSGMPHPHASLMQA